MGAVPRNHDELTLEMVTMSNATIFGRPMRPTRRARINLGIRRRS